jgi:hypothetical protein
MNRVPKNTPIAGKDARIGDVMGHHSNGPPEWIVLTEEGAASSCMKVLDEGLPEWRTTHYGGGELIYWGSWLDLIFVEGWAP